MAHLPAHFVIPHAKTVTAALAWLKARQARDLQTDSRRVRAGDIFVAWPGAAHDGRAFIDSAFALGASACVAEAEGLAAPYRDHAQVLAVSGLKAQLGWIAAAYYDHPSGAMLLTAVTGTNGKTSTAWWLAHAWQALKGPQRKACGVIGTLGTGPVEALVTTGLTTPDPVTLHATLRSLQQRGLQACVLEASSIGIEEHRLDGLQVRHAVFTNLTQDHLDYHRTMTAYEAAKAKLFAWPGLVSAIINSDDAFGARLAQDCKARGLALWTCAIADTTARLRASAITSSAQGMRFTLSETDASGASTQTVACEIATVGAFNVRNILGVIAVLRAEGVSLQDAAQAVRSLPAVPGRLELVTAAGKPWVLVDYAHTPDAVAQVLQALRPLAWQRAGKLWCVLGCGGDRDAGKRPLMGAAAARYADVLVVTSDNPRSEDPASIAQAVWQGAQAELQNESQNESPTRVQKQVQLVLERQAAIAQSIASAAAPDIVLLAGKGHETTIEEKGHKRPFDDRVWAAHYLQQWSGTTQQEL